jgi:hypothetical protein
VTSWMAKEYMNPRGRKNHKAKTETLTGRYRSVGKGPVLMCVRQAGIPVFDPSSFVEQERVHSYLVPYWAWLVFRWEVAHHYDNGVPGLEAMYDKIIRELERMQKDKDARYAYLTMIMLEHQAERGNWFRMAREALEAGWDA